MLLLLELSGQTYMKHNMRKMDMVAERIVTSMEELQGYTEEQKVCMIGTMEAGNYPELYPELRESLHWVTPYYRTVWETFDGCQNGWKAYMTQYMGKKYSTCTWNEYQNLISSDEYSKMNDFRKKTV